MPAAITRLPDAAEDALCIVQQCRPEDMESVRAIYANADIRADLQPFFADLPRRMAEAHLVIGRSGAGTVAELMAIGRPAILVPLPHAMDDNQTPNAEILANADAGWRVAQRDLSPDFWLKCSSGFFPHPPISSDRAAHAHALAVPDSAARLADMVDAITAPGSAA